MTRQLRGSFLSWVDLSVCNSLKFHTARYKVTGIRIWHFWQVCSPVNNWWRLCIPRGSSKPLRILRTSFKRCHLVYQDIPADFYERLVELLVSFSILFSPSFTLSLSLSLTLSLFLSFFIVIRPPIGFDFNFSGMIPTGNAQFHGNLIIASNWHY